MISVQRLRRADDRIDSIIGSERLCTDFLNALFQRHGGEIFTVGKRLVPHRQNGSGNHDLGQPVTFAERARIDQLRRRAEHGLRELRAAERVLADAGDR